ncbi:hypothetical protein [Glaciihabitans sp. dw_435]|uniref:hypothetical protein n=1 Tax=Glaciihabitans sp. dw_435 TaxID=2720081 RepID=UPI001BD380C4|nr:hypothetical protein [Glaciihabitans sp. dw_435]
MTHLTPGVRNVMLCETSSDCTSCTHGGAGHAILAIQERVTAATPTKWRDGIVRDVSAGGWIAIDLIESGDTEWVWNHADRTGSLTVGQPVALHALYHVLALGSERVNVLVAAQL